MDESIAYARSGDLHIAYSVAGDSPVDLFYVPTWISASEVFMEEPSLMAFVERICAYARVISFDRRGAGLSDPWQGLPTLEDQMDDILAVMNATDTERATLMGTLEGGPLAMLFAATHPDRVESLILYATYARTRWAPDYDWPPKDDDREARVRDLVEQWGQGAVAAVLAPSLAGDPAFQRWAGRMERYSASPGTAKAVLDALGETDVRHVLPSIRVPTLVMHRRDDQF